MVAAAAPPHRLECPQHKLPLAGDSSIRVESFSEERRDSALCAPWNALACTRVFAVAITGARSTDVASTERGAVPANLRWC